MYGQIGLLDLIWFDLTNRHPFTSSAVGEEELFLSVRKWLMMNREESVVGRHDASKINRSTTT